MESNILWNATCILSYNLGVIFMEYSSRSDYLLRIIYNETKMVVGTLE